MRIRPALLIALSATALVLTGCTPPETAPTESPSQESPPPAESEATETSQPAPSEPAESEQPEQSEPGESASGEPEQCSDALADAWLHLGTGDEATTQEYGPHAVDIATQPVGDADVRCAVGLEHPEAGFSFVLTVLTGDGVPEAVAGAAEAQRLTAEESVQSGAVASFTDADGTTLSTLYGPGDQVLSTGGIEGAESAYLLETTLAGDQG